MRKTTKEETSIKLLSDKSYLIHKPATEVKTMIDECYQNGEKILEIEYYKPLTKEYKIVYINIDNILSFEQKKKQEMNKILVSIELAHLILPEIKQIGRLPRKKKKQMKKQLVMKVTEALLAYSKSENGM